MSQPLHPFAILNIPESAVDAEVRAAYLDAIRRHGPDADPQRFTQIQAAYSEIKDSAARVRWRFCNDTPPESTSPLAALIETESARVRKPPAFADLVEFLRESSKSPT